jgi:hypothetical protein
MPTNEAGEFELVLGNKQLLLVFFIIVVLLGVFFTMGYVVGRNSAPLVAAVPPAAASRSAPPPAVAPSQQAAPAQPMQPTAESAPPTNPSAETPPAAEKRPAEAATPAPEQRPLEVPPMPGAVTQPEPGRIYMQVLATAKPEAEVLVDVLSRRGFQAIIAPGPNERLFRVLVGPIKEEDIGQTKTQLEQAGFKNAFAKRF